MDRPLLATTCGTSSRLPTRPTTTTGRSPQTAWATGGGDLAYTIEGLLDSTSYKVGVRAVNTQGPSLWTDPLTSSTPDHGRYISQATPLPVGGSLRGQIDTGDEGDLFEFTLPAAGRYWVFTTGELDTQGTLWDVYGDREADRRPYAARHAPILHHPRL